ncbi:CPBP family intramembrane metalloprotease [Candidatus Saccharibacteria bacterium]|nr:CPBP family intramembrane metalloprotease [Candidatus Saccharibacteria bacterium]
MDKENNSPARQKKVYKWWAVLAFPVWMYFCFSLSQALVFGMVWLAVRGGIPLKSFNQTVLNTALVAVAYIITSLLVIGVPWLVKKYRTTFKDLGLTRLPSWTDILLVPAGFIVYILISSVLITMATKVLPGFDINQVQDTGFDKIRYHYEYILAFSTLVIIAPIVEETLFRGYMFGKLKKYVPIWVAVLATSLTFGFVHGAWNLAIDTFALSLVLCYLRKFTGSIWSSVLLHMVKNGLAFYILFIYPSLLTTLVK